MVSFRVAAASRSRVGGYSLPLSSFRPWITETTA